MLAVCLLLAIQPARGDEMAEAKAHYKKAMSSYALHDFATAATEYEAAFKLEPDPALLYNAAQAHRVGGNSQRALELYQSYLRLFGDQPNRAEVEQHIAALKIAIEKQRSAAAAPPTATAPMSSAPSPQPQAIAPPPKEDPPPHRPWWKRGWVWGAVGGVVLVGVVVGVGAGVGAQPHDRGTSLGTVTF
jgi:tetratricopeptide (TPR) repeat protein